MSQENSNKDYTETRPITTGIKVGRLEVGSV